MRCAYLTRRVRQRRRLGRMADRTISLRGPLELFLHDCAAAFSTAGEQAERKTNAKAKTTTNQTIVPIRPGPFSTMNTIALTLPKTSLFGGLFRRSLTPRNAAPIKNVAPVLAADGVD